MLVYAYLIVGVISSVACIGSYVWVYADHGLSMKDLAFTADKYWSVGCGDFCPHGIHPALNNTCNCTALMDLEIHNSTKHYDCFTSVQQMYISGQARSTYLMTLIISQAFHVGSCRTRRVSLSQHGFFTNPITFFAIIIEFSLLAVFCYVPGVQLVMQTEAPPWAPALVPGVCAGLTHTAYNVLRKAYIRNGRPLNMGSPASLNTTGANTTVFNAVSGCSEAGFGVTIVEVGRVDGVEATAVNVVCVANEVASGSKERAAASTALSTTAADSIDEDSMEACI
ncbi:unnamed protein product [Sphagnum balticum]